MVKAAAAGATGPPPKNTSTPKGSQSLAPLQGATGFFPFSGGVARGLALPPATAPASLRLAKGQNDDFRRGLNLLSGRGRTGSCSTSHRYRYLAQLPVAPLRCATRTTSCPGHPQCVSLNGKCPNATDGRETFGPNYLRIVCWRARFLQHGWVG